jgi:ketosteroid isomerase-like protein
MRRSILPTVLASVVLLGCEAPDLTRQQRAVEEQFVQGRVTAWIKALNNKELEDLAGMYENSPDLTVMWLEGAKAVGFEDSEAMIADFYGRTRFMNFAAQSAHVEVLSSTVAIATFRHSVDVQWFDTRRDVWAGFGTLVWVKSAEDGLWRIHTQHVSVNP